VHQIAPTASSQHNPTSRNGAPAPSARIIRNADTTPSTAISGSRSGQRSRMRRPSALNQSAARSISTPFDGRTAAGIFIGGGSKCRASGASVW
jgi:hypothetical protein